MLAVKTIWPTSCVLAVTVACNAWQTAAASLITNGGFESYTGGTVLYSSGVPGITRFDVTPILPNSINGWMLEGATDEHNVVLHHAPNLPAYGIAPLGTHYTFANEGDTYLDLSGADHRHARIYQDMATIQGQSYQVSFYLGASESPTNTVNVRLDGASSILDVTLTPLAHNGFINWKRFDFSFVADSSTTRLSFKDMSIQGTHGSANNDNSYVDSVSVIEANAVPEPGSVVLFLQAAGACAWFAAGMRKRCR